MMSLGQDEPTNTYSYQYTRYSIRKAFHGGRVGANIQEFTSSPSTKNVTNLQNLLKSNSEESCNLVHEYKT